MADTLHVVWSTGALLGIRCAACDHRAVLSAVELPTIRRGNCAISSCAAGVVAGVVRRRSSLRCTCRMTAKKPDGFMRGKEVTAAVV
jgi:hypothetical protein